MARRSTLDFVLTAEKQPLPLRPYQEQIVQAAVEHFATEERGQVIAACGTGKTLMGMRIAERLKRPKGRPEGRRVLITAPTLTLLKQAMDDWQADYPGALRFTAVCSDAGVADDIGREELGLEPTTDPAVLRQFLATPVPKGTTLVVLATYQSTPIIAEAMHEAPEVPAFDLLIADEAHRTAGEGAGSPFRTVLRKNDQVAAIRAEHRLFMTATPREITLASRKRARQDGRSDARVERTAVYSMDDVSQYGEVIHELTLAESIAQGIIADYRLVAFPVRKSLLGRLTAEAEAPGEPRSPFAGLEVEEAASAFALIKAMETYGITHAITYHNRTRDAKAMARGLNWVTETGVGPTIEAATINGEMPMAVRTKILDRFRERKRDGVRSVLTNAKALTEGVNVKAADAVVFADPKESLIEVVQALGRVLRKESPQVDKRATVLMPMVVDDTQPGRLLMDRTSSDRMRQTLTELKLVDAKVMERLEVYPPLDEPVADADRAAESPDAAALEARLRAAVTPTKSISLREVIDLELAEHDAALRPVSPKAYHNVYWSEAARQWLACVRFRAADGPEEVLIEQLFDDAEEAARAVDRALNARGLEDWPRNFGKVVLPPPRKAAAMRTSAYAGVMYDHAMEQWVAHVRVHVAGKVIAAVRYAASEDEAARARDALVRKYGMHMPLNFPDESPAYERILLANETRGGRGRARGVERDGVTGFFWAYATVGPREAARVVPIGFFADEPTARQAVVAVEDRLRLVASDLPLEELEAQAQRAVELRGLTRATFAKRRDGAVGDLAEVDGLSMVSADPPVDDLGAPRAARRTGARRAAASTAPATPRRRR